MFVSPKQCLTKAYKLDTLKPLTACFSLAPVLRINLGKEKGEKTFTCKHDLTHTYIEEIEVDKNAHEFGAWQVEKPATTENDGTLAHKECIICNKVFDCNDNEIKDLTIPKIQNSNCDLSSDFVVDEKSLTCGLIISFLVIAIVLFLLIFKKKRVRS